MKILLRVRDLVTDETHDIELPDEAAARMWLIARPHMKQVLGVPTEGVPVEVSHALRDVMRPLDQEEHEAVARHDLARRQEAERLALERMLEAERAEAAEAARLAVADPKRPMKVRWSYGAPMAVVGADPRPLNDVVQAAVEAWIAERNTWVEGRGQMVGEATVEVYPADVPKGEERVREGGRFTPVTAVPKA